MIPGVWDSSREAVAAHTVLNNGPADGQRKDGVTKLEPTVRFDIMPTDLTKSWQLAVAETPAVLAAAVVEA